ncbi:MAG TPA: M1 family metallopeptidase, partial [Thermoanaerobaculia bacterium]|nr:M1 family metallopeptidase [Thermoanaerobaculia bacterium]
MKRQFVLSLLIITGAAAAFAQRLPQTVIPSHYGLTITPDLVAEIFRGEETIDVSVVQPVTTVTLHDVGLTLHNVRITSGSNTVSATVSMNPSEETVTLTTAQPLAAGPATIAFAFDGTIGSQLRGLYLSRTAKRKYGVTQFEATDARRAFPCFDEPAMKATFDIALVVDKGDTAISNGRIVSDAPVGSDKHRLRFSTTPKMSTYLVAMLVGDFDCIQGGADSIPIRVCGPPGRAAQLGQFALASAEQSIKFYDSYYGIKYPFEKLDMIAIPDFGAGAMENAGAITYRETAIFFDPKTSSYERSKGIAGTVAHEIAHQWFGDLVTMKWWDDIWLNEGFATFMSSKPLAAWKPEWNQPLSDADGTILSLTIDGQRATRPIRTPAETPAAISQLFDGIAYGKSAAVLRMVENWLGEETFRQGIRAYLTKYSWSNAEAEDFWGTMVAVSKQPVDVVMKSFVDQTGAPLLHASESCAGEKVTATLTQERLLLRGATAPDETWTIPLCVERTGCATVTGKTGTLTGGRCAEPLFLNRNGRGYYVTDYAP